MQNFSDENEFVVVRENEPVGETHFHMNGFTQRLVLTQRQKTTRKLFITLSTRRTQGESQRSLL